MTADFPRIPKTTMDAINEYVYHRTPPGGFLESVLSNDLKAAFGWADIENRRAMFDIVSFLWNYAPAYCWGSPERVKAWLGE